MRFRSVSEHRVQPLVCAVDEQGPVGNFANCAPIRQAQAPSGCCEPLRFRRRPGVDPEELAINGVTVSAHPDEHGLRGHAPLSHAASRLRLRSGV